jgi:plasmid maintenance system antidote protein VapI
MQRSRRLPAAPVKELMRLKKLESGLSWPNFARAIGVPKRTLERVSVQDVVTYGIADTLAIRLGTHPILIWGEDWLQK